MRRTASSPVDRVLLANHEAPLDERFDRTARRGKRDAELLGDLLDRQQLRLFPLDRLGELIQVGEQLELREREVELVDLA
jgi:hypothetical protein